MKKTLALCLMTIFSLFSCSNSKTASESGKTTSETLNSKGNTSQSAVNEDNSTGEDIILTMPIMVDHHFYFGTRDLVQEFNDADNGYKIVLKDYAEGLNMENISENTDWDNYNLDLTLDIMKGEKLDIIPNIFTDPGKFHILTEKGAFADLNPFIDNDENLDRSELFDEVLRACEINDELRYMPISFSIDTLAGCSKYVGTKENWTFEEMKEHWEKMPEGSTINGHTTEDYVYYALLRGNISSFIDYDNAECHFDSDKFIKILDFIDSFEDITGFKQEINGTSEEFVSEINISGFKRYHQMFWRYPADEITFIGYPSDDGYGSLFNIGNDQVAVSATSSYEKQKGAWEFIRMLVSYDCQYGNGFTGAIGDDGEFALPINKRAFEDMGENQYSHEGEARVDEFTGQEIPGIYLTKAEYEKLFDFIPTIQKINIKTEDDIYNIIEDEIFALFNKERTSKEVSDNIQNRVQLLVSERS